MTTRSAILAAIKAKLEAIPGIGQVHDYERYAENPKEHRAQYVTEVAAGEFRILGWFVSRVATSEVDLDTGEVRILHSWRITGFVGLDDADASEKLFNDLVDAIADAFRTDRTLGGLVDDIKDSETPEGQAGVQVEAIEPVLFTGALAHRARLRLVTETTAASA